MEQFLDFLDKIDNTFWNFIGAPAIVILGLYFSYKSNWIQIIQLPQIFKRFINLLGPEKKHGRGIHPLYAFFATIGGTIGIGNIVGVATAVQIGGPGAVFWLWITALLGMIVKYSEIFLGIKYRIANDQGTYDGGPMIFLQKVFKTKFIPYLVSILLCIYGVEIYIFRIMSHSISTTWNLNKLYVTIFLLIIVLFTSKGGIKLVGRISSVIIPIFIVSFSLMSLWIFFKTRAVFPSIIYSIFKSAFTGHAAVGAFLGSSLIITISQGVRRACYSEDIGVGYASIIHSETQETDPHKQAVLGIIGILLDTFVICTLSVLLILVTGVWTDGIHEDYVVAAALEQYFPYVKIIWPIFIFLLGYSTVISYFSAGQKAAMFVSVKYGKKGYFLYAFCALIFFSFIGEERHNLMIMSITGMLLLTINLYGIFKLRNEIRFKDKR